MDSENVHEIGDGVELIDPHDGLADLNDGVLRHVSEAFAEDPLRVLRVARYAGRFAVPTDEAPFERVEQEDGSIVEYTHRFVSEEPSVMHAGFRVAEETQDMMRRVAPELNRMSRDRIGTEIEKALAQARRPNRIFEVLRDSGALAVLFPELDRAELVPAGPDEHHAEGSTFDHTMLVLNRMHRLCVEHDIEGHDRVRRLLMALIHDIGKVVSADKQGGLHSDDPPVGFPDHASLGAAVTKDVVRRLGLSREFENVMSDACDLHMNVHDVPMMAPNELLDFFEDHLGPKDPSSRTLPLGGTRASGERRPVRFHRATVWELIDLAHADHEGRLKTTFVDSGGGVTDTKRRLVERPTFDREPFVRAAEAVIEAQAIEGYEALETGLCDEHADSEIDRTHGIHEGEDKAVHAVMSQCPDCRSPADWVGEMLESMKVERLQDVLEDNC